LIKNLPDLCLHIELLRVIADVTFTEKILFLLFLLENLLREDSHKVFLEMLPHQIFRFQTLFEEAVVGGGTKQG